MNEIMNEPKSPHAGQTQGVPLHIDPGSTRTVRQPALKSPLDNKPDTETRSGDGVQPDQPLASPPLIKRPLAKLGSWRGAFAGTRDF